ncbi:MAG: hypothetical protein USCGTAYLOR_02834 [Chromatiales bacterium USCg_Taylor]|nr:MAG: hypothetical protein USCGTAYLOR_02834 [Chromatiales bacterium USCg_Taylor]
MDLRYKVGDCQLQLMRPQPAGLALRNQTEPRPQIQQDVGGLGNHPIAGLEKRRRERQMFDSSAIKKTHRRREALAAPRKTRHIHVVGARLLEREPHEFATALYAGPVVELIAHTKVLLH